MKLLSGCYLQGFQHFSCCGGGPKGAEAFSETMGSNEGWEQVNTEYESV